MSFDSIIILKFLNENSIVNVKEKINELMIFKETSFSNFNSFISILPDIVIKTEDLEIYKTSFLQVAKLSINLFVDFSYYKRFKFKETFTNLLYKERLSSLGYKCIDGIWKYTATQEPNRAVIQKNIFIYHLICKLLESKIELSSVNESSDVDEPILVNRSGNIIKPNQRNEIDNSVSRVEILNRENPLNDNENELILKSFDGKLRESWTCTKCTFVNDIDLNNCGTCFLSSDLLEENSPISLTIPSEKSDNDNEFGQENPKINLVELSETINSYWLCPICTFKNKSDCVNCETCLESSDNNTKFIAENLSHRLENSTENLSKLPSGNGNDEKENSVENLDLQNPIESIDEIFDNSSKETTLSNCLKCKKSIDKNQQKFLCDICSEAHSVCCNEACTQLNKAKKTYCKKCKVRKNSNMKNGILFEVKRFWIFNKKRWQCNFCFRFNTDNNTKCEKCLNSRYNVNKV